MNIRKIVVSLALAMGAALPVRAVEFTRLEYITSNGAQYFDTGIVGRSDLVVKMRISGFSGSDAYAMGAAVQGQWGNTYIVPFSKMTQGVTGIYKSNYIRLSWGSAPSYLCDIEATLQVGRSVVTVTKVEDGTIWGSATNSTANAFNTGYNLYAFALNNNGTASSFARMSCYSMDIWQDGVLVRSYRPARRSDGTVGMIDLANNNAFSGSATETPFVEGPEVNTVNIAGNPVGVGAPRPAYGEVECTPGETYSFSTDRVWTNDAENAAAVCTGWTYELADGTTTSGSSLSKSIVYDAAQRAAVLTWQFEAQYKLTVSATARGEVGCGWHAHGTQVSVPVPQAASEKYRFDHWEGDGVTAENCTNDPITVTMNGPVALTACFTSDYTWLEYVESTGRQYVDTGLRGRAGISAKIDMSWEATGQVIVMGSAGTNSVTNTKQLFAVFGNDITGYNGLLYAYGTYRGTGWTYTSTHTRYLVTSRLLAGDQQVTAVNRETGDVLYDKSGTVADAYDTERNMYLFGWNDDGIAAKMSSIRIYAMDIFQDGVLVRRFRPPKSTADREPGLYDTVNDVFYASESGVSLVAAPVVEGAFLTVTGSPAEYGRSDPDYFGATRLDYGEAEISLSAVSYDDGVAAVELGDGHRVPVTGCSIAVDAAEATFYPGTSTTFTVSALSQEVAAQWMFSSEQYRVVARAGAHGKVSVNGGAAATCVTNWVAAGSEATITAVPDSASNEFIGWTGDLSGSESPKRVTVSGPIDCTASFTAGGNVAQWTGGGDGRWSTASNWSGNTLPGAGTTVSISAGATVTVDCRTPELAALIATGEGTTLVFDDGALAAPGNLVAEIRAEDVQILDGAVVTHARNTMQVADYLAAGEWKMNARVFISCSNLTIDASSAIDVDGKGFYQTDVSNAEYGGPGPGGGNLNASTARAAAGHGGYGSGTHLHDVAEPYVAGMTYGSFREPVWCGSAGDRGSSVAYLGFPGGGAVRIVATGTVAVDGRISASSVAVDGTDGGRYGGSGGSIWISSRAIVGSGTIAADGGTGASTTANNGYTGGGGRIAIEYNAAEMDKLASVPALTFSVDSPTLSGPWEASSVSAGDVGTLYFTDTRFIGTVFSATGTGVRNGEIHAGSWSGWAPASLTVNDVRLRFVEEGSLNVSIAGAVTLSGENARLYFGGDRNYAWSKYGGIVKYSSYAPRVTFGSLTLNSGSDFYLCPAATNGVVATDRQTQLTVTGKLAMKGTSPWGNGDTVLICDCHPVNGAAGKIVCGSCEIDSDNVIRSKGFGTDGSRDATAYGLGPGAATRGGAGHGGVGTTKTPDPGGITYGSVAWPLLPGSTANGSGPAGGVVVLEVGGGLKVNGRISADSVGANGGDVCASSGGSVCITCETLCGNGTISALSANPSITSSRDSRLSGGGGRIAIHYDTAAQAALETPSSVKIDVRGGTSSNWQDKPKFENADMGTVWLPDGTLLGNTLSTARGVQAGEIHLGDWSSWRPSPLTVDGVRVRLAPETALLELPGNVVISNTARLGFGGGTHALTNSVARLPYTKGQGPRVKIAGDVTLARGTTPSGLSAYFLTEFELLAGEATGSDATIGGELEIGGKLTVATNCCVRFTSHPLTGASCFLKVRELQLDNGGTIDAMGRGFTGTSGFAGPTGVGPGAGSAEAASGGHGGNGGAPTEETQGLAYDEYRAPLLPGSGGVGRTTNINQWDSSTTSPVGAGGGVIRIDCRGTMSLAGTVTAAGDGSDLRGNGAGAGGSVFLRCKTWNPSDTLVVSADGGDHSSVNGYGGGGGRIAILRSVDNDPTPLAERLSVSAVAGASNGRSSVLPTDGTVHWGRWGDGLRVIVR